MYILDEINARARQAVLPVLGALIVGYFAYHSVKGDHGLSAYLSLSAEISRAEQVLAERNLMRTRLEHRANLLRPDNLDLDTLDERARAILNVIEKEERVIVDPR